MIIVASLEAVALIAIVFLFLRQHRELEQAWTTERRELLTRIQRPELVPRDIAEPFVVPDLEADEIEMIGTIADPPSIEANE